MGSVTSHIQGFFYRTIALISKGIKPIFVFDGKPPELKINELQKRKSAKQNAEEKVANAKAKLKALEESDTEVPEGAVEEAISELDKQEKRTTRVTAEHNNDVQKLLGLMGLPIVIAPAEAEAQCAELVKSGKAFAAASEDMDLLTFGSPVMLRKLTLPDSVSASQPPLEIHLDKALGLLGLKMPEFIDLCILLGCDYAPSIKGIGPKKGFQLIKEHKTLESVVASLDKIKYVIPDELMENLNDIRAIFKAPEVTPGDQIELHWGKVNEEELMKYLVDEKGFNTERVQSSLKRFQQAQNVVSQKRMDSFFKPKAKADPEKEATIGFKRSLTTGKKPKGVKRRR